MTDQFYGEESIKIKQTAKTGWVQSEFRKQEKYRRNYYGTIFLEILLDKMQRKEDVLYIESVRAPRVVRVKRRKKEPDPKNCNVMEKQMSLSQKPVMSIGQKNRRYPGGGLCSPYRMCRICRSCRK